MKLIDRLILKEIIGPWIFGVSMFTSLLMAGLFLGRLTGWMVEGVPPLQVAQIFVLYLPAVVAKTFPMGVLLAALLSFGRLSADTEITALRAAGASITRIVLPVTAFSAAVAILGFLFNDLVVPGATRQSLVIANEITRRKDIKVSDPLFKTVIRDQKLRLGILAKRVNPLDRALEGVTLVSYNDKGEEEAIVIAKRMSYIDDKNWRIDGGGTILMPTGETIVHFETAWPNNVPQIGSTFTDLIKERDDDFDAQSMAELRTTIDKFRADGSRTPAGIANYEYGYWNKISIPCAAIVFGTLGAVLGIRNQRTGTATGFAFTVAIIFGYQLLTNFMAVWAQGGAVPAWVASFGPLFMGGVAAAIILYRRNVS